ncbi:hypothetical protein I546_7053 [Mycobacterium kansasii 732]|nr:hypothetical protein I546_7053 [Mycobacterium kansasii 732]
MFVAARDMVPTTRELVPSDPAAGSTTSRAADATDRMG